MLHLKLFDLPLNNGQVNLKGSEMEIVIKVKQEYIQEAKDFFVNTTGVTKEDIKNAIFIRSHITNEISNQFEVFAKLFAQKKSEIEASNESETRKNANIQKLTYEYIHNIQRDVIADNYVNLLSHFINSNTFCDICKDSLSLVNIYLQLDCPYNQPTIDEINQTRQNLCDAKQKCQKPNCTASRLIRMIDEIKK